MPGINFAVPGNGKPHGPQGGGVKGNGPGAELPGEAALRDGDYPRAVRELTRALEEGADPAVVLLLRGEAYRLAGEAHLALADLNEAARLAPDNSRAHYNRALLYSAMGAPGEALAAFSACIDREPCNA